MTALLDVHDVLLADLDGTLYRGSSAIAGAVGAVRTAAGRGVRTVFVTNNASRDPATVAAHLTGLGFAAAPADVATSAQAAAALLARRLPPGAAVLVVGTAALAGEIEAVGLRVTRRAAGADAVVQGHDPQTAWPLLAEAALAVRDGALWVAANLDASLPTERGLVPGNGAMVAALRAATGRTPEVAGKPVPVILHRMVERTAARRPLVVGDRLDTDVAAGRAAGLPTMLVLTGVAGAADVLAAPPEQRPDLLAADLGALLEPPGSLAPTRRPGWAVEVERLGTLRLAATAAGPPVHDALRTLCAHHWAVGGGPARVVAADPTAAAALVGLGMSNG